MSSTLKRYEAAVKLSTGEVVTYHNINTGLYKFHQFLCEKFSSNQKWIYYKVRRKSTKETIGTYRNFSPGKSLSVVELVTKMTPNPSQTGFFIPIPFVRDGFEIMRNVFISKSQIISLDKEIILIPEWLFRKVIEKAQDELYQYYLSNNHQLLKNEMVLGNLKATKKLIILGGREEERPELNYP